MKRKLQLEQGAASYVPKAQQAERLLETVQRVLARSQADVGRQQLRPCPGKIDASFFLGNDPSLINPLVNQVQQMLAGVWSGDSTERIRAGVALEEALLNALYHGTLEISAHELAQTSVNRADGRFAALVQQRRVAPAYRNRKIVVHVHITPRSHRFVICDEGPGFDRAAMSKVSVTASLDRGHHRGLMLMRSLMDEVKFNDVGNEVTLIGLPQTIA